MTDWADLAPFQRGQWRRRYGYAPWCWSAESPRDQRPQPVLQPGQVALLGVSDTAATLWLLEPDARQEPGLAGLGQAALLAWQRANEALGALPVLWHPLASAKARPVLAREVVSHGVAGKWALPGVLVGDAIDGASYGLPFLLAQASLALNRPVPPDLASSATVAEDGTLGLVAQLGAKIELLNRQAPGIRRLLVAAEQQAEAESMAGPHLQVIGVSSATAALRATWDDLEEAFVAVGLDAAQRAWLIDQLVALAFGARDALTDWTSIHRTATLALERWRDLSAPDRRNLAFVRAVAQRHENNRGELRIPSRAEHAQMPEPYRTRLVAQVLQQAADTATPSPAAALAFAARTLAVRGPAAFPPHLEALGATARLHAAVGAFGAALALAAEATRAWLDRNMPADASYPLCLWLRVAGATGDREWQEALAAKDRVAARLGADGGPYVRLAWGVGLAVREECAAAIPILHALLDEPATLPHHVRHSAARWLIRCAPDQADSARQLLATDHTVGVARQFDARRQSAVKFLTLTDLDSATARQDGDAVQRALDRLRELEPQPAGLVLGACPAHSPLARGEWLARWYPY